MADFTIKQIETTKILFDDVKNITLDDQNTDYINAPLVSYLDPKLLQKRKYTKPITYRRPNYLRYIDYI